MSDSFATPRTVQSARLLFPWDFPGKNTGVGCHFLPGNLPDPGIELLSPALAGRFLTAEPPGRQIQQKKEKKEPIIFDSVVLLLQIYFRKIFSNKIFEKIFYL